MRTWIAIVLLALLATGCAGPARQKGSPAAKRPASGFISADAKNVHDFLIRYQTVITGEDEKAVLRLYADGARMVPYLFENSRALSKKDLETRLPQILKLQRRANMRLTFREPMSITVYASGERANVQALADLSWQDGGADRQQTFDCAFHLERIDYLWKIRETHQVVAAPGQTIPGQTVAPAAAQPKPVDNQFNDTPQRPIIPTGDQQPRPLF